MKRQPSKTSVLFKHTQDLRQELRLTEDTRITRPEMPRPAPASSLASALYKAASRSVKNLETEKIRPAYTSTNSVQYHETKRHAQNGASGAGRRRSRGDMERMAREIIYGDDPSQWGKLKKDLAGRGLVTHYGIKASLGEVLERRAGKKSIAMEPKELPSEENESRGHPLARFYYEKGDDDSNQTERSLGLSSCASLGDEPIEPSLSAPTFGGIISYVGSCAKKAYTVQDASHCVTPRNSWQSAWPENTPLQRGLEDMGENELTDILEKALKLGS